MASALFNSFKRDIMNGGLDLDTDTIKAQLHTSTFAQNIDTMTKRSDLTNEASGTGYTAGGASLANKAVTVDNTNDRGVFDSDDLSWSSASITARYVVLYKSRGGASSADELIGSWDMGSDIVSTAATFAVAVNANGWLLAS